MTEEQGLAVMIAVCVIFGSFTYWWYFMPDRNEGLVKRQYDEAMRKQRPPASVDRDDEHPITDEERAAFRRLWNGEDES